MQRIKHFEILRGCFKQRKSKRDKASEVIAIQWEHKKKLFILIHVKLCDLTLPTTNKLAILFILKATKNN